MFNFRKILMSVLITATCLAGGLTVYAADENPGFFPLPKATEFGDLPDPVGTSGTLGAQNLLDKISQNLKYLIGALAVALIVYGGFKLVTSAGSSEALSETKSSLAYLILGLAILGLAYPLSQIFTFEDGGPLNNSYEIAERVGLFKDQTVIVITFIKYILGSIATLFTVISGAKLITAINGEGAIDEAKKSLTASAIGLITVMFSGTIIDKVLYKVDLEKVAKTSGVNPGIDAQAGMSEIIGITNLVVGFIAPVLVLVFIIAGVYYVLSIEDEGRAETAKKWMKNAFIGLLVVYGAFAITSTFIAGNIDGL